MAIPPMSDRDMFVLANRAFDLFTLAEREHALREFGTLSYPSIADRFIEAVHRVIVAKGTAPAPPHDRTPCAAGDSLQRLTVGARQPRKAG
jgi:hypothetical protein